MLVPYFEDGDAWKQYRKEVLSWEGTPYRHLTMIKGRGADCTLFIGAQWKAIGVLKEVKYDYYPKDWHIHTHNEFVIEQLYWHWKNYSADGFEILRLDTKEEDDFIRGDILCFALSSTGVTNHAAIWFGEFPETREKRQMYNSINDAFGKGVCRLTYGSFWRSKLTNVFRVMREV